MNKLSIGLLYKFVWMTSIYGWVSDRLYLGALAAILFWGILHALFKFQTMDYVAALLMGVFGLGLEIMHLYFGIIPYGQAPHIPIWLFPLWTCFYIFLEKIAGHFFKKPAIQALIGFFIGPLTYSAAASWKGIDLAVSSQLLLSIEWAIIFPLSLFVIQQVKEKAYATNA